MWINIWSVFGGCFMCIWEECIFCSVGCLLGPSGLECSFKSNVFLLVSCLDYLFMPKTGCWSLLLLLYCSLSLFRYVNWFRHASVCAYVLNYYIFLLNWNFYHHMSLFIIFYLKSISSNRGIAPPALLVSTCLGYLFSCHHF